jgi:hypothetical protein
LPEVNFDSPDEKEFESQVKNWRGKLSSEVESSFNPEASKYFSSTALSESRKARLERKRQERASKANEKAKVKPRASKKK